MKKNVRRNSREKENIQKKRTIKATLVIAFVICAILGYNIMALNSENKEDENKITDLTGKLEQEELRKEELDRLEDEVNSDSFVEKIAREKFNLCYPDDIVFVPNSK